MPFSSCAMTPAPKNGVKMSGKLSLLIDLFKVKATEVEGVKLPKIVLSLWIAKSLVKICLESIEKVPYDKEVVPP